MKHTSKARELTHALIYNKETGRWSCKCGYVLGAKIHDPRGEGHAALYARCPMYQRRKKDEAYAESSISSTPHEKTKPARAKVRRGVSQTALDLFDL